MLGSYSITFCIISLETWFLTEPGGRLAVFPFLPSLDLFFFLFKYNINSGSYLCGTPAVSPSPKIVLNNFYNFLVFIKEGMIQTLDASIMACLL